MSQQELIYAYLHRKFHCGSNYLLRIKLENGVEVEVIQVHQLHRNMDPIELDIQEMDSNQREKAKKKMYIQKNRHTDFYNMDEIYDSLAIYREAAYMNRPLIVVDQGVIGSKYILK